MPQCRRAVVLSYQIKSNQIKSYQSYRIIIHDIRIESYNHIIISYQIISIIYHHNNNNIIHHESLSYQLSLSIIISCHQIILAAKFPLSLLHGQQCCPSKCPDSSLSASTSAPSASASCSSTSYSQCLES